MHIGIDLGTTYSLVGHRSEFGAPVLFPDRLDANEFRTSSTLLFDRDSVFVGLPAVLRLEEAPGLPHIRSVKRRMGDPQPLLKDLNGLEWTAEQLSALILRKLLLDVQFHNPSEILGAVITVPACFGVAQRQATRRAALAAGLPVQGLMEEPIAAAAFYGAQDSARDRTILVYDFGGGTFDATLLHASPAEMTVLATSGEPTLGGNDIDSAIMDLIHPGHAEDVPAGVDPEIWRESLRSEAEKIKIRFSNSKINLAEAVLRGGETPRLVRLVRSQYVGMVTPILERTLACCEGCLREAGLSWKQVDLILCAGGSSLIPEVASLLGSRSGLPGQKIILKQPHQAVAYGAALLAPKLCRQPVPGIPDLKRVSAGAVCLRVWNPAKRAPDAVELIGANALLPATLEKTFFTSRENQQNMRFQLLMRRNGGEESLGEFVFNLPSSSSGYPVKLRVVHTVDGTIEVSARDGLNGAVVSQTLDTLDAEARQILKTRQLLSNYRVNGL